MKGTVPYMAKILAAIVDNARWIAVNNTVRDKNETPSNLSSIEILITAALNSIIDCPVGLNAWQY
jgi:hypothetical protein